MNRITKTILSSVLSLSLVFACVAGVSMKVSASSIEKTVTVSLCIGSGDTTSVEGNRTFTDQGISVTGYFGSGGFNAIRAVGSGDAVTITATPLDGMIKKIVLEVYNYRNSTNSYPNTVRSSSGTLQYDSNSNTLTIDNCNSNSIRVTTTGTTKYQMCYFSRVTVTYTYENTPTVTTDSVALLYGQTLSSITLSSVCHANVAGAFKWADGVDGMEIPLVGTNSYEAVFTPTDTSLYTSVNFQVLVTATKADQSVTAPTPATSENRVYTGNAIQLLATGAVASSGDPVEYSVDGSETWVSSITDVTATTAGPHTINYRIINSSNYNDYSNSITVNISQAVPSIFVNPSASSIQFGDALSMSSITGGTTSTPGSFAWQDGTVVPQVSDSESTPYVAVFTPSDLTNYEPVNVNLTVHVDPIAPDTPAAVSATYGQTLSDIAITGAGNGTWTWVDGTQLVGTVGSHIYTANFTSSDSNYSNASNVEITVNVSAAAPTVDTWPTASAITYGQTLADSDLTGGSASVEGTFSWETPTTAPSVAESGTAYNVVFTPNDSGYSSVTGAVSVVVNKATSYTVPSDLTAVYDQTLADVTLPSGWTWNDASTSVGAVGTNYFLARYTPDDTDNYNIVNDVSVPVVVTQSTTTVITPPTASDISYGQSLSSSTLSGGAGSVGGTFTWFNGDTVPDAGTAEYTVLFTPDDSASYLPVTCQVSVTVNPVDPDTPSGLTATEGQTLSDVSLPSGWAWVDANASVGDAGTNSFAANYTPSSTNYNALSNVMLAVTVSALPPEPDSDADPAADPDAGTDDTTVPDANSGSGDDADEIITCEDGGSSAEPVLTPEQIRELSVNNFVENLYIDILDRTYDVEGRKYWSDRLLNGESATEIVIGFINSRENIENDLDDETFVRIMYRVFTHRTPSDEEVANWTNALASGASRIDVLREFAGTSEWASICAYYGVVN